MSFFADLHGDDARLGGKARSLARLSAAGLRAPTGFVVTDELFRAIGSTRSLWSVRSSFANEDVAGNLGAGVYESRVAVRADEVGKAIRQVLASALSPGAVAYALAHIRP